MVKRTFISFLICLIGLGSVAQIENVHVIHQPNCSGPHTDLPVIIYKGSLMGLSILEPDRLHEEDWSLSPDIEFFYTIPFKMLSQLTRRRLPEGWDFRPGPMSVYGDKLFYIDFQTPRGPGYLSHTRLYHCGILGQALQSVDSLTQEVFYVSRPLYSLTNAGSATEFICHTEVFDGKMDLLLIHPGEDHPEVVELGINTEFNEIMPVWRNGDLYFASDRGGNFDIYVAYGKEQWQAAHRLPEPLNSDGDEFAICFLDDRRAYISSDRGEKGNADIYYVEWDLAGDVKRQINGLLAVGGVGIRNAELRFYNEAGELIHTTNTNEEGYFAGPEFTDGLAYRIETDQDANLIRSSTLYLLDEEGRVLQELASNSRGVFLFQFLPYDDPRPLKLLENPDESSLFHISLSGQVFKEVPGDVGEGERLMLLSEDGEAEHLTYTKEEGMFRFDEVAPRANYQIQLEDDSGQQVRMSDGSEPEVVDGVANYSRLRENDLIRLNLPDGSVIEIRSGEVLELATVQYEFDKFALTESGKLVLKRLAEVLKANPNITAELGSHTDSRGNDTYNQELSEKRARGAVDYLVSLGISRERLSGKGFGESRLLNQCGDGVECSEEEHARNRRTEIILRGS